MKKLIASICALALICAMTITAAAEIDLSGMSWQELIDLKAAITKEQMSRDEWQEVEVPVGVWKVGEDIPAGTWTLKCTVGSWCVIAWGYELDNSGHDIAINWKMPSDKVMISNADSRSYNPGEATEYILEAKEGMYIVLDNSSVTFAPFAGKPALGFK